MNNFGIMFHHFHDNEKHIVSQGSISANDLKKMIQHLRKSFEIINADVFYDRVMSRQLKANQICLTFDDALACQYDIAYPVLEELKIKAFWFIYTSFLGGGGVEKLEVYRHFRFKNFDTVESFYDSFFKTAVSDQNAIGLDIEKEIAQFIPGNYLQQFSFYTDSDKLFRYLRDCVLKQERYYVIMDNMIKSFGYDIEANKSLLWMNEGQIQNLHKGTHIIGLHSHTHPTVMKEKTYDEQLEEYSENKKVLKGIIGDKIFSVSYPCNSYNDDTDKIMNKLGISIGFNAAMSEKWQESLHLPRKDHAYVLKEVSE